MPIFHETIEAELGIHDSFNSAANSRLETDGLATSTDASVTLTTSGRDRAEALIRELNTPMTRRAWRLVNLPFPAAIVSGVILLLLGITLGYLIPRPVPPVSSPAIPQQAPIELPIREITARNYEVISIVDGDTFRIEYDGVITKVRIANIDTPERGEANYDEAIDALASLIQGRTITIAFSDSDRKRDNWGRLLCTVEVGEIDVGEEMIRSGLAQPWE